MEEEPKNYKSNNDNDPIRIDLAGRNRQFSGQWLSSFIHSDQKATKFNFIISTYREHLLQGYKKFMVQKTRLLKVHRSVPNHHFDVKRRN